MTDEIRQAVKLLTENGYRVLKFTEQQLKDSAECERLGELGESMDCAFCSCSRCIAE